MTEHQPPLIPLNLGEQLRHARTQQKLSLENTAEHLKIDIAVLESMESNCLDHLAPVYRRGYVRTYAQFLKFDASKVEEMLGSIGNDQPELHTVFPEAGDPNQADRWLKATSYVLASLLVGTLAWQFTHEAVRLSQSGKDMISGTVIPQESVVQESLNSATQQIDGATHVNASIGALDILQKQRAARNTAGEEAWAALQQTGTESAAVSALSNGEFILDLTASSDSWVEISDANGTQLELDLVRAGSSKQYKGTAPFSIQFGHASAINLFVDGQAVDLAPYTTGDVTQMMLDTNAINNIDAEKNPGEG